MKPPPNLTNISTPIKDRDNDLSGGLFDDYIVSGKTSRSTRSNKTSQGTDKNHPANWGSDFKEVFQDMMQSTNSLNQHLSKPSGAVTAVNKINKSVTINNNITIINCEKLRTARERYKNSLRTLYCCECLCV